MTPEIFGFYLQVWLFSWSFEQFYEILESWMVCFCPQFVCLTRICVWILLLQFIALAIFSLDRFSHSCWGRTVSYKFSCIRDMRAVLACYLFAWNLATDYWIALFTLDFSCYLFMPVNAAKLESYINLLNMCSHLIGWRRLCSRNRSQREMPSRINSLIDEKLWTLLSNLSWIMHFSIYFPC